MSNLKLFDLTYRVARHIKRVVEETATGGSTTTIVDTNNRTEVDDFWNDGVAWILRDSGGASAAPEGEYSVISDFANSTKTITLRTTLTAAVASGDKYAICRKEGNDPWLGTLIQSVNKALMDLGPVPYTDTTTITTAGNQTEYSLPIAANQSVLGVWKQGLTGDSNDNQWIAVSNWYIQHSAIGTADLLILPTQLLSGRSIKVLYKAPHPELHTASSELSEHVPEQLVVYPAVLHCLEYLSMTTDNAQKYERDRKTWEERVARTQESYRVNMPRRRNRMFGDLRTTFRYPGERRAH